MSYYVSDRAKKNIVTKTTKIKSSYADTSNNIDKKKEFILPHKNIGIDRKYDYSKAFSYLTKVRKIDDEIVKTVMSNGLVYQSKNF